MNERIDNSTTRSLPPVGDPGSSNLRYALSQLPPSADRPPPPERLGTVRLLEMIGRGGMGRVYRGWDEALHREVAVKFVETPDSTLDKAAIDRFMEGARAAANVKHMNLTTLLQADQINGVPYLVMEFVRGETLQSVVNRRGPLSPALVLTIVEEVCGAVAALHETNILHLDIKPSNILLDVNGRTYLTDFGLTLPRVVAHGDSGHAIAGTPPYMAPEMFDGVLSPRTDVYALGITAFQLLTGHPPFRSGWPRIAAEHRSTPLPLEELREKGVPEALIEEIERATHKQQTFRHKGARQLQERITGLRRTKNTEVPSPSDLTELLDQKLDTEDSTVPFLEGRTPIYERVSELVSARQNRRELPPESESDHAILPLARPVVDPITTITMSLLCTVCYYDLQGLSRGGRCPECGTEKAWALRPDRLIFADNKWLEVMRRSVMRLLVAQLGVLILLVATALDPLVRSLIGRGISAYYYVNLGLAILVGAISLICYFKITRAEPTHQEALDNAKSVEVATSSRILFSRRSFAILLLWLISLSICITLCLEVASNRLSQKLRSQADASLEYINKALQASAGSSDKLMEYNKEREVEYEKSNRLWNQYRLARRITSYGRDSVGVLTVTGIAALCAHICTIIRRGDRKGDLCRVRGYFVIHWAVAGLVVAALVLQSIMPGNPIGIFGWILSPLAKGGAIAIWVAFVATLFACIRAIDTARTSPARTMQPNVVSVAQTHRSV